MVFIRPLLLAASITFLTACQLPYLLKNGYEQTKILSQRKSIEKVLKDDAVSDSVKAKIRLAMEAKEFAEAHLGLTPTKNYSSYVDLKRPYVSWIVQAAKAYELSPHLWKFPLVGALPYKGYFSEEAARKEAKTFDPGEFDTYVRGVTAYSTLGWFDDPLLNTMMNYSDPDLVELIIHESVHATLYIKSEAEFNERLATFVGQLGAERFYLDQEGPHSGTVAKIHLEQQDQKLFSDFITRELTQLEKWYQDHAGRITVASKADRLKEIQLRFESELKPKFKTEALSKALRGELNNAILIGFKTYQMDLDDFEAVYLNLGKDIKAFIEFCKTLEDHENPNQGLKDFLKSSETAAVRGDSLPPATRSKG